MNRLTIFIEFALFLILLNNSCLNRATPDKELERIIRYGYNHFIEIIKIPKSHQKELIFIKIRDVDSLGYRVSTIPDTAVAQYIDITLLARKILKEDFKIITEFAEMSFNEYFDALKRNQELNRERYYMICHLFKCEPNEYHLGVGYGDSPQGAFMSMQLKYIDGQIKMLEVHFY